MFAIERTASNQALSLSGVASILLNWFARMCFNTSTIQLPCNSAQEGPLQRAVGAWGP